MLPNERIAKMTRIAVIGDAMIDRYIYGRVERISPEAPIPVFIEDYIEEFDGGAANVAYNVAALDAEALLLCQPTRALKVRFIANFQQVGVRHDIEEQVHEPVDLTPLEKFKPDLLIVSDYAKGAITLGLMDQIRSMKIPFIVDPKTSNWSLFVGAKVITPNEREYAAIACKSTFVSHAVVVTRGAKGAMIVGPGDCVHVPTQPIDIADPTGAGDTFIAALGVSLAKGMELVEAVKVANAAAGVVVRKRGTACCTKEELEAALC